jgi:hypothetical protein
MRNQIVTGHRLIRLIRRFWAHPVITMPELQDMLGHVSTDASRETVSNYVAALQQLGMAFTASASGHLIMTRSLPVPGLAEHADLQTLYQHLCQHSQAPIKWMDTLGRLLDAPPLVPPAPAQSAWCLPEGWVMACQRRQACDLLTPKRWLQAVPMTPDVAPDGTLLVWDLTYQLPVRLACQAVQACHYQPVFYPNRLSATVLVEFVLSGNLAKRFEPTVHDVILAHSPTGQLHVAHQCKNADALCHRLLRYQTDCHIVKPTAFRHYMADHLKWLRLYQDADTP